MAHYQGLTSQEVAERRARGQSNDFSPRVGRTYWQIVRDNVFNLFNIVLFTLLLIVLVFGDYSTVVFAGFSVFTNTVLGLVQEINAKRKLNRMAALAAQKVRVWRDGELRLIDMKEVVIDDLIVVEPGDRFVVDGRVIESDSLEVDESLLTGESDGVFKNVDDPLSSGSFCIAGSGVMIATRVGAHSTINQLSVIAKEYKNVLTPTQHRLVAIVEISVAIMFVLGPMLFLASYRQGDDALGLVRNAVVFVTSLVPQGLVLVATVSLTIGAVKISRYRTLIQRINAVESLANVTTLCFDKTGTITENRLAVTEILPVNGNTPEALHHDLYQYIHNLSYQNRTASAVRDYLQIENAHFDLTHKTGETPFTSTRKWGAVSFETQALVMGAPERLLCPGDLLNHAEHLAENGLRVLAFCQLDPHADLKAAPDHNISHYCQPLALVVMSDQVREDIRTTLEEFRQLNVKLKVISGDNLQTVRSIAGLAGLPTEHAYTGAQLEAMSAEEFAAAVQRADVFARIEPNTKRRIVQALRDSGEYVAMVGDGVNDVPALKAAELAIVMNDGAQISKDVADIVLLNNAMSTLPLAFREGREITQTIFGTCKMFLTKNAYNLLMFVFIGFMSLPFPITPVQISISAFGTVNMPATLIAFGIVRPRYIGNFRRDVIEYILVTGVVAAIMIAFLYAVVYTGTGGDLNTSRSVITVFVSLFGMMVVWNVQGVEVHDLRSFATHRFTVLVSAAATFATVAAFHIAPTTFEFTPVDITTSQGVLIVLLLISTYLLTLLLVSHATRHRRLLYRVWSLVEKD